MKQAIQTLITELEKEYWYCASSTALHLGSMKQCLNENRSDNVLIERLELLLENIPAETNDHDWMRDELKEAIKQCETIIEQNEILINQLN
jgi:hypothetical protein